MKSQSLSLFEPISAVLRWTFAVAMAGACVGALCACTSDAVIAESSKTQVCRDNVLDALRAFQRDKGLAFAADSSDADSLFSSGQIIKSYARDAVQHTSYFRLETSTEGCRLAFFKRKESEPGHTETVSGSLGSVLLPACHCK